MIITHTSNPSIDYYMELSNSPLTKGVQRAENCYCLAGGKGLNVSMILNQLQVPSIATTFLGGFSGDFICKEMHQYSYVQLDSVVIEEANRINVKIRNCEETDINAKGPSIQEKSQNAMLEKFKRLKENDWLLVCGSLAQNVNEDFLRKTADLVQERKARLVLDIGNLSAGLIAACKPYLIKPNVEELMAMFDSKSSDSLSIGELIQCLQRMGVENVLLSNGAKGATYFSKKCQYRIEHPELVPINTVGSGDSMLAAVIAALEQGTSLEEALIWGAAAGEATAVSKGLATRQKMEELKDNVKVSLIRQGEKL